MPHDSECVDCGEHDPTYKCDSCKAPLCGVCWNAGYGDCDDCQWDGDDDYCPDCGQDWGYCECEGGVTWRPT